MTNLASASCGMRTSRAASKMPRVEMMLRSVLEHAKKAASILGEERGSVCQSRENLARKNYHAPGERPSQMEYSCET